jgi:cytochrome c553
MRSGALSKILGAAALLGLALSAAAEGDPQAGKSKSETCMGCHGVKSYRNAYPTYHVPKLAGQHADYILIALQGYKYGLRSHNTMHANASELSDEDMLDIAAYFSQQ